MSALPEIPGARYVGQFLTVVEEDCLIAFIDRCPWLPNFKRRRMWFGYGYDVGQRRVPEYLGPLPPILQELGAVLVEAGLTGDPCTGAPFTRRVSVTFRTVGAGARALGKDPQSL